LKRRGGLARITELAALNGASAGLQYRSANWAHDWDNPNTWRASASYVTGGHTFKAGYVGGYLVEDIQNYGNDLNLAYTFLNGRPSSLTETLRVFTQSDRVRYDALYGQDQWTMGNLTLQGALRYDHAWSFSPPQTIGPTNFLATQLSFPRTDGVNYKDISPRGGAAWDVFGNGKTAVKVNVGKYEDPASNLSGNYSISNPIARIATTTGRTWVDANGDFTPQCDFTNPAANGECLGMQFPTFGTATPITAAIDPSLLNGWGIRPNDWQIGASIQQQLMPRVSVEFGYFRRWLNDFTATDNTLVTAGDFTSFALNAPSDPRLPGGGGYAVTGLSNITQAAFARGAANNITDAANFGTEYSRYNGILVNVSVRPTNGLNFQGGINSGKTVQDICAITSQLPELSITNIGNGVAPLVGATNPYCHTDPGFITKLSGVGSYTLPKIGVLIAGTIRSDQGAPQRATWNVPLATISSALGRPAVSPTGGTTIPVDLIAPGEQWGDRVNEFDMRFAKILKFGRMRTNVGLDIYNILNSAAVLTYNQTFIPATATAASSWLAPTAVLTPRFFKISAQIDF
jgi:hypothetical protein